MSFKFHVGRNALTNQRIRIPLEDCLAHWYVPGSTGQGKSKFLELFCRTVIDAGVSLVVIDAKGDLVEDLLAYCIQEEQLHRVAAYIDLNDMYGRWAPGINLLQPVGNTDAATHADLVLDAVKILYQQQDEFMPWLERFLPATAVPLILKQLTMAEVEAFASPYNRTFASAIFYLLEQKMKQDGRGLTEVNLQAIQNRWLDLATAGKRDAALQTAVVQNRASLLTQSPMGEAVFGQQLGSIDWLRALNTGQIVLINAKIQGKVTARLRQALGVSVILALTEAAQSRSRHFRPPAFCVCDEFQEFVSNEFERGLDLMRSWQLFFVLAHQHMAQLEEVPALMSSIITNCQNKCVFHIQQQDAERLVYDMFKDHIHGDHIKQEIYQTKFRPKTRWVDIYSDSEGTNWSDSSSSGSNAGTSGGMSFIYGPAGLLLPGPELSHAENQGNSASTSWASGSQRGGSSGTTVTHAPITEYEEFMELSSREMYSLPEIIQRCITWITGQHPRRAQLQIGQHRKPIPIVTREVQEPVIVPEVEVARARERIYPRCARPYLEVIAEIRARPNQIIEEAKQLKQAEEERQRQLQEAEELALEAALAQEAGQRYLAAPSDQGAVKAREGAPVRAKKKSKGRRSRREF